MPPVTACSRSICWLHGRCPRRRKTRLAWISDIAAASSKSRTMLPRIGRAWWFFLTLRGTGVARSFCRWKGSVWIVTLTGRYDAKPPDDEAGFFSYIENLRTPTAHKALRNARRLTGFSRYVLKASRRRYFEGVPNFPQGLLPFGDTICRFNPVYGQGMSVAAIEACLLHDLLAAASTEGKGTDGLASTFLTEAQKVIETPWSTSAVPDFVDPLTEGPRPPDLEKEAAVHRGDVEGGRRGPCGAQSAPRSAEPGDATKRSASAGDCGSRESGDGDSCGVGCHQLERKAL